MLSFIIYILAHELIFFNLILIMPFFCSSVFFCNLLDKEIIAYRAPFLLYCEKLH
jgi:hypothetical protein